MDKIASPKELQAELRSVMAFIQGHGPNGKPDRQVIAAKLRDVACRVAAENLFANDGFVVEAGGGSVAEATFKKLRDGSWGLLVNNSSVRPGDKVLTITKAGKRSYKIVGKVVWSGNGVAICTISESGNDKPPSSGKASPRQVDYAMNLLNRIGPEGWLDSDWGQGTNMPRRSDIEKWPARDVSALIDSLRREF
jgi:hypothetical protein